MTIARPVTIPAATTVRGGVLAHAGTLPSGWERGIGFAADACRQAGSHLFCPTSPTDLEWQEAGLAEFAPFGVVAGVACTTLTPINERLDAAEGSVAVIAEYNIGLELATGSLTNNPSLADATTLAASADIVAAVATIDGALAGFRGYQGWVHMSPQNLVLAVGEGVVEGDPGDYLTPNGHRVVASPGYAVALADEVVGSAPVYAGVGMVEQVRTVNRKNNEKVVVYEAAAMAAFDPCLLVSTTISGSGG